MSRAFGGTVRANPVREIGWGEVRVADNGVAREWLGELQAFETFQWHGETFSIPPGATRVLEGEHCPNQAFALGRHFGMQCHVEMTAELVRTWIGSGADEIARAPQEPGGAGARGDAARPRAAPGPAAPGRGQDLRPLDRANL